MESCPSRGSHLPLDQPGFLGRPRIYTIGLSPAFRRSLSILCVYTLYFPQVEKARGTSLQTCRAPLRSAGVSARWPAPILTGDVFSTAPTVLQHWRALAGNPLGMVSYIPSRAHVLREWLLVVDWFDLT